VEGMGERDRERGEGKGEAAWKEKWGGERAGEGREGSKGRGRGREGGREGDKGRRGKVMESGRETGEGRAQLYRTAHGQLQSPWQGSLESVLRIFGNDHEDYMTRLRTSLPAIKPHEDGMKTT
jgi:hypothetical protein